MSVVFILRADVFVPSDIFKPWVGHAPPLGTAQASSVFGLCRLQLGQCHALLTRLATFFPANVRPLQNGVRAWYAVRIVPSIIVVQLQPLTATSTAS